MDTLEKKIYHGRKLIIGRKIRKIDIKLQNIAKKVNVCYNIV